MFRFEFVSSPVSLKAVSQQAVPLSVNGTLTALGKDWFARHQDNAAEEDIGCSGFQRGRTINSP